jgi:release factor H-coupled RctB family protein
MPAKTLTIILNSNQSKKFALLLQSPDSPKDSILREARNKFRIKGLFQVFLQGGTLLGEELPNSVSSLWIGKGEPYNGPPQNKSRSNGNPGEIRIIADKSYVDEKAVKQLELVASLPGVQLAVGMPDLHPGNRFPIGCAVAAEGVYPALIGSDVGCGIALYTLSSPSRSSPNPSKLAGLLTGLDEPWDGSVEAWLAQYGIERTSEYDRGSLGTVGAGNHFAEICSVERIVDEAVAQRLGIQEGALYLLGVNILIAPSVAKSYL